MSDTGDGDFGAGGRAIFAGAVALSAGAGAGAGTGAGTGAGALDGCPTVHQSDDDDNRKGNHHRTRVAMGAIHDGRCLGLLLQLPLMQLLSMQVALFCEMGLLLNSGKQIANFNKLGVVLAQALISHAMVLLRRRQLHSAPGCKHT